jgi:RimJ/RimL family protein N-acetyltransferase
VDDKDLYPPIARPLPEVMTERLELRRFRPDDLDGLAQVFAHPEVWQYPHGRAFTRDETATFLRNQVDQYEARGFGVWNAVERASGRIVGYVGVSVPTFLPEILPAVEVGWRFEPSVWGRGYASEGAIAALDESFTTLGLEEVCSLPQSDNLASVRVAERLGMRLERMVMIPANERFGAVEAACFVITRAEWMTRRDAPSSPQR